MARILVLEDDYIFRQTLEGLLTQFDHEVESAESAEEALQKASAQQFDLLISDVRIAGDVDGVEALARLKKLQPQLRSILMTGFSDIDAPLRAAGLQADDYLLKPFKMQTLLVSVRSVLNSETESSSFLARLTSAPGKAAERALRWFYDGHLQQLEEQRQKAVRQFFVLVRSKRLSVPQAQAFFATWEQLELDYLRNRSPQSWARLVQDYHRWGKQLMALEIPSEVSETYTAADFEVLYARIQSGVLEPLLLLKAVELLHFPEARKRSLDDFCAYHWLWGRGSEQGDPFLGVTVKGYRLVRQYAGGDSVARVYEAEAEYLPDKGDRVLCLPDNAESQALLRRELRASRAKSLATMHDHHFLLYPNYSMSLKARLPANGSLPYEAWKLLRPVFLQVVAFHRQAQCSGCFSLRDIDWPPGQDTRLTSFSSQAYEEAHRTFQEAEGLVTEFFSAPEVTYQAHPTPASDQAVLGRLLFETVYGGRYPDHSLRIHIRLLGQPESNRAFAPYVTRLGPLTPVFYRLSHADPEQRFPSLEAAVSALDALFQ